MSTCTSHCLRILVTRKAYFVFTLKRKLCSRTTERERERAEYGKGVSSDEAGAISYLVSFFPCSRERRAGREDNARLRISYRSRCQWILLTHAAHSTFARQRHGPRGFKVALLIGTDDVGATSSRARG